MKQMIRELERQAAGEKLEPEQLKGLIRTGYVYRIGDEHHLTDMGRHALVQPGASPEVAQ
jgi:Txe/YoeB family toxin of Txe-Axe toxin-antitoxin module